MLYLNRNLFNKFPPAQISEESWRTLIGRRTSLKFTKRDHLPVEHQHIDRLVCITKGRVKVYGLFQNGKEMIFELLEAPAIIGYQALFTENPKLQFPYIVALDATECVIVPVHEVKHIVFDQQDLLRALFINVMNTLTLTRQQASWNWNLNYTQRVAYALMLTEYSSKDADGFFEITHEDLASFVGISRANVTAAVKKLYSLGLINKQFGKIKVMDIEKLDAYIHNLKTGVSE